MPGFDAQADLVAGAQSLFMQAECFGLDLFDQLGVAFDAFAVVDGRRVGVCQRGGLHDVHQGACIWCPVSGGELRLVDWCIRGRSLFGIHAVRIRPFTKERAGMLGERILDVKWILEG